MAIVVAASSCYLFLWAPAPGGTVGVDDGAMADGKLHVINVRKIGKAHTCHLPTACAAYGTVVAKREIAYKINTENRCITVMCLFSRLPYTLGKIFSPNPNTVMEKIIETARITKCFALFENDLHNIFI